MCLGVSNIRNICLAVGGGSKRGQSPARREGVGDTMKVLPEILPGYEIRTGKRTGGPSGMMVSFCQGLYKYRGAQLCCTEMHTFFHSILLNTQGLFFLSNYDQLNPTVHAGSLSKRMPLFSLFVGQTDVCVVCLCKLCIRP